MVLKGFLPFLTPSKWCLGLGLFQKMCHNLLYIQTTVVLDILLYLDSLKLSWLVGKSDFNESQLSAWTCTFDFDLEFVNYKIDYELIKELVN